MRTKFFATSILWAAFLVLVVGCGGADELAVEAVPDTSASEPKEASVDELIDSLISDEESSDAAGSSDPLAAPSLSLEEEEFPQHVLDAPVRNVVMKHANGKTHKAFQGKVFGPTSVVQHGRYEEFFASGKRLKSGSYDYGKKVGDWKFWDQNGTLRKQGMYVKDVQHGDWQKFRKDGSLEWIEKYKNGLAEGVWVAFREDGKTMVWRRGYKNGDRHGHWEDFQSDGNLLNLLTYNEGELHGDAKSWNEAGKLIGEGVYQDGKRHGRFRAFDEDGRKVVDEALWESGVRQRGG